LKVHAGELAGNKGFSVVFFFLIGVLTSGFKIRKQNWEESLLGFITTLLLTVI
jgi:hypothetical protein